MANLHLLAVFPPGLGATGICGGFVLTSNSGDQLAVAFRRDWEKWLEDDVDAEVINEMEATFVDIAENIGSFGLSPEKSTAAFIDHINTTYSNLIRSIDSMQVHSALPLKEHACRLRRTLLGEALPLVN